MSKQIKLSYIFLGVSVLCAVLHNAVNALFKVEEPVFFMLTLLLFLAFIVSLVYSLYTYLRKGKPKDIWKLGFLGLLGLVGLLGQTFYAFFALFVFFGAKRSKLL